MSPYLNLWSHHPIERRCYLDIANSPYSSGLIFDSQFYKFHQCQTTTLLLYEWTFVVGTGSSLWQYLHWQPHSCSVPVYSIPKMLRGCETTLFLVWTFPGRNNDGTQNDCGDTCKMCFLTLLIPVFFFFGIDMKPHKAAIHSLRNRMGQCQMSNRRTWSHSTLKLTVSMSVASF